MVKLHIIHILQTEPLLVLFITIALGYFIGKFRIKTFKLGGIAGSLMMGVLIGKLGIPLPKGIGSLFFALFIYAVGYQGGPQFFRSLNRQTLVQLVSATLTCLLGLGCVLIAAYYLHLDRGTAAGLAAGGLTQSAIIGTASDALSKLSLSPITLQYLQANIAIGYAVCYIFGSFGPILLLSSIFPAIMGWDIRAEAKKLANTSMGGNNNLDANQLAGSSNYVTRIYRLEKDDQAVGQTLQSIFEHTHFLVEAVLRQEVTIDTSPKTILKAGDIIAITAHKDRLLQHKDWVHHEISKPTNLSLNEECRQIIITNKIYHNKTLGDCLKALPNHEQFGIIVTSIIRMGENIPPNPDFVLKRGDDLCLLGRPKNLDNITQKMGAKLGDQSLTGFVAFGLGMSLGMLLGMITIKIRGISISMGTGGGCLIAGLIIGYLRSCYPRFGNLPSGASNFLRDFGLAVFVASVGLTAGPQAFSAIEQHGSDLVLLGVFVTIVPTIISFFVSYYLLGIKNPIELLATIAGGRSANPGFAALLEKAGNATPVVPFTATYTLANIWLTLWGPVIIALITQNH